MALFWTILLCLGSALAGADTLTIVSDEWMPYNGDPEAVHPGYMIEVAREAFATKGHVVKYQIIPWKRALDLTRQGQFNAVVGASHTDAAGFIFPQEELAINRLTFWKKAGSPWLYSNHQSVETVTLGVIEGYDYREWLNRYIEANRNNAAKIFMMHGDSPLRTNIRMLLSGRIGAIVDAEPSVRYELREMGVQDSVVLAGRGTIPTGIYIAFSPALSSSKIYTAELSEGIVALRKSGRLKVILAQYGLEDWK